MLADKHLVHVFLCMLPLSAALSPPALEERDHGETYSYTKMGGAYVHDVQTYHHTSTRHCTVTKTDCKTTTKYVEPKHEFTTTVTTTTTFKAKKPYTSTIPPSKGFIPITDSVPGASYIPAANIDKREPAPTSSAEPLVPRHGGWGGHGDGGWMGGHKHGYPQKVDVVHWHHHPKCHTETTTHTKTHEECKNHAPKTITKTETATTTKYPSTASPVYGACQTDVIANSYKNLPIVEFRAEVLSNSPTPPDPPGYTFDILHNLTSAYGCCAAAISASPPAAFWGIGIPIGKNPDPPTCVVAYLTGCTAPRKNPSTKGITFEIRSSETGFSDDLLSYGGNAYCGQYFRGCTVADDGTEDCTPPKVIPG